MLRKLVFMLLIVSLALSASSAFCTVWRYWGNIAPDTIGLIDATQGWKNFSEYASNTTVMGSVVNDPAAIDGKAWRINDTSAIENEVWRTPGTLANPDGLDAIGATIVARVKTVSADNTGGGNIGIANQNYGSFVHWGGANGLLKETVSGQQADTMVGAPADGNYHIIRLTAQGEFPVAVPINYNFDGLTNGNLSGQNGWSGDATNNVTVVDGKISVAAATANPSGGTPASREFVVDPDANGKITVTCTVDSQSVFVDGWVYQMKMLDSNGREMAGWQGGCDYIRARIGGVATGAVTLTPGTHNLKIVYDVTTDIGSYYIDETLHGTLKCDLLPNEGNRLGSITFTHKNDDARAAGHSVTFDNLVVDGATLPYTARVINMYVDDVLKKSFTYDTAQNIPQPIGTSDKTDNFVFGSGAGIQDVYFDWIVVTNEGAFAPNQDVAHFGGSLSNPVLVDSFGDIATAPIGSPVSLTDAIVTASFMGAAGNIGFAVADPLQFAGVRVVSDAIVYPETVQNIEGTIGVVDGERVVLASNVTESLTPLSAPVKPVAYSNKSAAGGASGVQPAMVDFANKITGGPAFADAFTYASGPLAGKGGWTGDGGSAFAIENNTLKLNAFSWDYVVDDPIVVTKTVSAGDCGTGQISLKMKIKKGASTGNFWYLRLKDTAGIEICYLMGQGSGITGRTGTFTTGLKDLTGNWDNLEIRLTGGTTAEFFLNGVSAGSTTVTFDGSIGSLVFERPYHTADPGSYAYIDDIQIFPDTSTGTGLNTVGVYSTIYGRVYHVKASDPATWDDYFYIDDGTGYIDGTADGSAANIGVRCRPASKFFQMNAMPANGQYVKVTGVMGAKNAGGNIIRYFWTDGFEVVTEE